MAIKDKDAMPLHAKKFDIEEVIDSIPKEGIDDFLLACQHEISVAELRSALRNNPRVACKEKCKVLRDESRDLTYTTNNFIWEVLY